MEKAHALWQPAALSCYTSLNSQRYTLMAEDAVESAGAKAPAITFLIYDSPRAMENMMQSDLFIGGNKDSLNLSVPPDLESVQLPAGITGKETCFRD